MSSDLKVSLIPGTFKANSCGLMIRTACFPTPQTSFRQKGCNKMTQDNVQTWHLTWTTGGLSRFC